MMKAVVAHSHRLLGHAPPPGSLEGDASTCARLLVELAWAKWRRDGAAVERITNALAFSGCDPRWAECVEEYLLLLARHEQPEYRTWARLSDSVLPLKPDATVAIVADWGTGMGDALALMRQVASFRPDVILHLGDIYYSGTVSETGGHFLDVVAQAYQGVGPVPPVLTLSGNHDRYSGGQGYYSALDRQGLVKTSFFCLRNDWWQLLAMDTGLHDWDPFTVASNVTYLEPSEVAWHQDKLENSGQGVDPSSGNRTGRRGTILLSHHQLFSETGVGEDPDGARLAVNLPLLDAFSKWFPGVAWWFWGHEHDLKAYQPYAGLQRGRCVGASAVPVFVQDEPHGPVAGLVCNGPDPGPPALLPQPKLGDNGTVMDHCFVVLTLKGPVGTAAYYAVDTTDMDPAKAPPPPAPAFTETVDLSQA
jgi:hypothetical protein